MIHDLENRISPPSHRSRARHLAAWVLLALCLGPLALHAQVPAPPPPPGATPTTTPPADDRFATLGTPEEGECPPPSTQEKIMIGVGLVALAVVLFFLLVRLIERRYIQQDRNAKLGRHVGISLTLFLSAGGFLALVYLITGCIHPSVWLWLAFWGVFWAIHGLYTLIAVRSN